MMPSDPQHLVEKPGSYTDQVCTGRVILSLLSMQSSCQKKKKFKKGKQEKNRSSTSRLIKMVVSYHPESQVYKVKIKIKLMESYGWFAFPRFVSTANRDLLSLLENAFFLIPTSKSLVQKTVSSSSLYKFVVKTFTVVPRCCRTVCLFKKRETRISQEKSINIDQSPSITSHQKFLFPLAFNEIKSLTLQICLSLAPKIVVLTKLELSSRSTGM